MNEKIIIDVGVVGEDNAVKGIQRLEISVKSIADATTQAAEATQKFTDSMKEAGDVAKTTADANNILADKYHLNAEAATQNAEATQNVAKAQEEASASGKELINTQRKLRQETELQTKVNNANAFSFAKSQTEIETAKKNYSSFYNNLTRLEGMGTPAVLKAATWSVLGVGGIAYEGIKQYANFNRLMTQTVTQAGVPAKDLPYLNQQALDIAKQTGTAVNDVANMFYRVASGTAAWNHGLGATKQQLAGVTRQVANLNMIGNIQGGATSEQSARVITAILNANLRDVGSAQSVGAAQRVAELVNAAVGAGDIRQSELVSALGRGLLVSASSVGMRGIDAMAWLDTLTSLGTPGAVAGTYVKSGINILTNPSTQGVKALGLLGIAPGEIEKIISGHAGFGGFDAKGQLILGNAKKTQSGLTGAVLALSEGLKHFAPLQNFPKYKGSGGAQGAINYLENWGINQIKPQFIKDWEAGKLSQSDQQYVSSLILTKAFGGSKQFATIAALIQNPQRFIAMEEAIARNDNLAAYNKSLKMAENTPAVQFHKMLQTLNVDLIGIGKTLTPWAIKLGKGFVDIIGALAKFKFVLYPLVAMIAGFGALAGISKIAGIMRGAYSLLGGGYTATDRLWAKLAGSDAESGRSKFFSRFLGHGQGFKDVYSTNAAEAQGKIGAAATKFGSGAATFSEAVDRMVSGEATTGANASVRNGVAQEVANMEKNRVQELSDIEKSLLAHGEMQGKVLTKSMIRSSLLGFYPEAGKGRSKEFSAQVDALYNKLRPMQNGVGQTINKVASSVENVAETAGGEAVTGAESAATGMFSRFAGMGFGEIAGSLGGSLLGALGGPMGMLAMTSLLPMAMPLISKGLSWLFSSSAPVLTSANTKASLKKQISAAQKQAQADLKKGMGITSLGTLNDYFKQLGIQGSALAAEGTLGKDFLSLWEKTSSSYYYHGVKRVDTAEQNLLKKQLQGDKGLRDAVQKANPYLYAQIMGTTKVDELSRNSRIANLAARNAVTQNRLNAQRDIAYLSQSTTRAQTRMVGAMLAAGQIQQEIRRDWKMYNTKSIPESARKQYADNAETLKKTLKELAQQFREGVKESGMKETDINKMAEAYANSQIRALKNVGFTPESFATAFASALKGNGPALAAIVAAAQSTNIARGNSTNK